MVYLFPYHRFTIQTNLELEQAITLLKENIKIYESFWQWSPKGKGDFEGTVSNQGFVINRIIKFPYNTSIPIPIKGNFIQELKGVKISIKMKLPFWYHLLMVIWFGSIISLLSIPSITSMTTEKSDYIVFIFSIIMILFSYLLIIVLFSIEAHKGQDFIEQIYSNKRFLSTKTNRE